MESLDTGLVPKIDTESPLPQKCFLILSIYLPSFIIHHCNEQGEEAAPTLSVNFLKSLCVHWVKRETGG